MIIRRAQRKTNYTIIPNAVLENEAMTWGARGLLSYLLSKPDNWTVNVTHLERSAPDGKYKLQSFMKELETCGYLVRTRVNNSDGTFSWDSTIMDEPVHGPSRDLTIVEKSVDGEQPSRDLTMMDKSVPIVITEKDITNTDKTREQAPSEQKVGQTTYDEEFEVAWSIYPLKKGKKGAWMAWRARLKFPEWNSEILTAAARRYAHECKTERREPRYTLHASTFWGPQEKFADYLEDTRNWSDSRDNVDQNREGESGVIDVADLFKDDV